jgi:hypothetical protein
VGLLTHLRIGLVAALVVLTACSDDIVVDLSHVDGPRVLAIAATPAEAAPDDEVQLHALWVDEDGERTGASLTWTLCTSARGLAELGPVADACIDGVAGGTEEIGATARISSVIPDDACRLFGPDPPPAEPGQPLGRPVAPDHSGGYYQPILAEADDELAVYGVRLECGIAGATQAQAAELRMRHRSNLAPVIDRIELPGRDEVPLDPSRVVQALPEQRVELRVGWARCAQTPSCGDRQCTLDEDDAACTDDCPAGAGCSGAEWYARFDPISQQIVDSREAIGVAWYATDGRLEVARTGRSADDPVRTSDNVWIAPAEPGRVTLWMVLRDDRGGVSWRTLFVEVVE